MSEDGGKRVFEFFGEGKLFCAEAVMVVTAEAGGKEPNDFIRLASRKQCQTNTK